MLEAMPWGERWEISRYRYGGTKKWAKRRIHKIERQQAKGQVGVDEAEGEGWGRRDAVQRSSSHGRVVLLRLAHRSWPVPLVDPP